MRYLLLLGLMSLIVALGCDSKSATTEAEQKMPPRMQKPADVPK